MSDEDRRMDRSAIGAKLIRRLSLRPSPEELEERNILKSEPLFINIAYYKALLRCQNIVRKLKSIQYIIFAAENSLEDMKREREEKKRYLLRKLSFRPTIEELKCRKVTLDCY